MKKLLPICLLLAGCVLFCSACDGTKGTVVYEEYVDPGPTPVWDEPTTYEYGSVLTVDESLGITFEGVRLTGTRGDVTAQEQAEPAMTGIHISFRQGENVNITVVPSAVDHDPDHVLEIFCVPHIGLPECHAASFMDLSNVAYQSGFVADMKQEADGTFTGQGSFKADCATGDYDLLFYYGYSLCYYMIVKVEEDRPEQVEQPTQQPAEEKPENANENLQPAE